MMPAFKPRPPDSNSVFVSMMLRTAGRAMLPGENEGESWGEVLRWQVPDLVVPIL